MIMKYIATLFILLFLTSITTNQASTNLPKTIQYVTPTAILTPSSLQQIRIDTVQKITKLKEQSNLGVIRALAWSPDNQFLAIATDTTFVLYDENLELLPHIFKGHSGQIKALEFSPNGKQIASGSDDGTIRLWQVNTGDTVAVLRFTSHIYEEGLAIPVFSLGFSPNGGLLAAGSEYESVIHIWDTTTYQQIYSLKANHEFVASIEFSLDGNLLVASGGNDPAIYVWKLDDKNTSSKLNTLNGDPNVVITIFAMTFTRDSTTLASGDNFGIIKLWDTSTRKVKSILKGHTEWINTIDFNTDGTLLISSSFDRTTKFWNTLTGEELLSLSEIGAKQKYSALSPSNTLLAIADESGTLQLWGIPNTF
jgi:WD40 repeat protein